MCGIAGFNWEDKELIRNMDDVLKHRGPDGEGVYTNKGISLGHRRLSIIDLSSAGKQPMCNEEGTIWITYNGEIYNFKELRENLEHKGHKFKSQTDTEVIIHAYEEWGHNCLQRFNGMFAFAIWDENKKELFLARDRLGIKPLYYYWDSETFIFASEIKAILVWKEFKRKINYDSLQEIFQLSYSTGEKTIFKGINKILPGHYAILKKERLTIEKYWDLQENISEDNLTISSKKLRKLLEESVKKRLISDVPIGVYLSGGLDSSTITAIASKYQEKLKTFSVGFGEGLPNELKYARKVADYLGTDHHEFIVTAKDLKNYPKIIRALDEPIGELALLPTYMLSQYVKKHATVVLAGEGADELFGGYLRHQMFLLGNKAQHFLPKIVKKGLYGLSGQFPVYSNLNKSLKILGSKNNFSLFNEIISISDKKEVDKFVNQDNKVENPNNYLLELYNNFKSKSEFNKTLYVDIKTLLPDNYFMKADRMTMACGIEERVPFLDHNIAEFSMTLKPQFKRNLIHNKIVLRAATKDLLPKSILKRPKRGYNVPIDRWFKNELKEEFENILDNPSIEKKKILNYDYAKKIFNNFNKSGNNYQSNFYNMSKLWNVYTFDLWHEIYFGEERIS